MANEPELGVGSYRAEQVAGAVIIHAHGETFASGYKVWLQQAMIDVFPPEFVLYWQPPDGMAADVMTPFDVQAEFPADERVRHVTVRDADGAHTVPVG